MMKFYREAATRILAAQKFLSTILITRHSAGDIPLTGNLLTGKEVAENGRGTRVLAQRGCGKAEDGRG
jgi:hypothetical protein